MVSSGDEMKVVDMFLWILLLVVYGKDWVYIRHIGELLDVVT